MREIGHRSRTVIWALCMAAAFVTTHLPPPKLHLPPNIGDKVMHCAGYAALGILTIWRTGDMLGKNKLRLLVISFAGLAVYGIFDEATQPIFGRTFEWLDWAADLIGAAMGIAVIVACYRFTPKAGEADTLG
jgi:VanZ family protein